MTDGSSFTDTRPTCLPEDLLLLSARLSDGRIRQPNHLDHALAGAVLAELVLAGALRLDGKRLQATGATPPLPHPAVAEARAELSRAIGLAGSASLSTCLYRVRRRTKAGPYLASLTAAGLLRRDESRFLGIIPLVTHTLTDPSARVSRVARIDATLASPGTASPRDLSLTTLAATVGLTYRLHPTRPDRTTRRLLTTLTRADPLSAAVARSVRNAESADAPVG